MDTCPITLMQVISKQELGKYQNDSRYQTEEFIKDYLYLLTSKLVGDNLPVGETKVEHKPCLNPKEISQDQRWLNATKKLFYPLEKDRLFQQCSEVDVPNKEKVYDLRYVKLNDKLVTSLKDM